MNTIYIDMDGVVAGFDEYVKPLLGRSTGQNPGDKDISEGEWEWLRTMHPHLYAELPVCKGALDFADHLRIVYQYRPRPKGYRESKFNIEFLTAIPRTSSFKYASYDKITWCIKFFPDFIPCIGPYAKDKMKLSKVGDILIDDREDNITQWAAMGGQAILHEREKSFDFTIKALYDATHNNMFPGIWKKGERV